VVGEPLDAATVGLRSELYATVRAAARPFRGQGWQVRSNNLAIRGADGAWGQIVVAAEGRQGPQLVAGFYAGTVSAYLMQVVNGLDPEKVPPLAFVGAHTRILWQAQIRFDPEASDPPSPLTLPQPSNQDIGIVLGPTTAAAWLAAAFAEVVPRVDGLCSDLAIRDWLLDHAGLTGTFDLRYAALLTRHLAEVERDRWWRAQGIEPIKQDRSTRYPQSWSHRRFLRFFEATPR
jgi:hypothetical protein